MRNWVGLLLVLAAVLATASAATAINPNDANWDLSWPQAKVEMPLAWNLSTGNKHVIVAVVDTGVDPSLKDLQGALVPGWDFISGGYTKTDLEGHGTLVASIIAARGNNHVGIAGYCWSCRVMPVRVSNGVEFDDGLAAQGIRWAADHGARIISLGFSDEGDDRRAIRSVAAAIAYAAQKGVLVLASAGNTGSLGLHLSRQPTPARTPWRGPTGSTSCFPGRPGVTGSTSRRPAVSLRSRGATEPSGPAAPRSAPRRLPGLPASC